MDNQQRFVQEMDNQQNFAQEMMAQKKSVQELGDQEKFVKELGAQNMCWELPAENKPVEMGSGELNRSWVPAEEKAAEIPCPGKSPEES